jgi:protein-glutamine gamma-glutamyltransferase
MLTSPPLLIAASLLLWGWQTGFLVFGAIMGLLIEASRLSTSRWEFSQKDYDRIWNLCAVLFLGVAVYCFASNDGAENVAALFENRTQRTAAVVKTTRSVLLLFQWLPAIFFPIIAAQAYGTKDKIDISTFSWTWRRRLNRTTASEIAGARPGVNIAFIYFGVCLFAATMEKSDNLWFYPLLGLLIGWSLFTQRCRRFSVPVWTSVMLLAGALGFGAQFGLKQIQHALERLDSAILSRFGRQGFDGANTPTAIGSIGRLNLSGRIVLRLRSEAHDFPGYLREASYNAFKSPVWHATLRNFTGIVPETNETTWILLPQKRSRRSVTIGQYLPGGRGLLALPSGTSTLEDLPGALEANRFGAVKMEAGPGLANYVAKYDLGATVDGPPNERDLEIPIEEDAALSQVATNLGLVAGINPKEALKKVATFFQNHFEYSSYLAGKRNRTTNESPLARFLLRTRSGHCEYFATATTLLLRKAAVPTRYAVGYSVQEIDGARAVVRQRHAHTWCLVHIDGVWQDFDTTPPSWSQIEAKHARFWEPLSDAWSRLWFEFSKWRYGQSNFRRYIPWLVAPILIVLLAQLLLRKRSRARKTGEARRPSIWPGLDSEFYKIERSLAARGFERLTHESWADWIRRINSSTPGLVTTLPQLLSLHYQHRFDPNGISPSDRKKLAADVEEWLRLQAPSAN